MGQDDGGGLRQVDDGGLPLCRGGGADRFEGTVRGRHDIDRLHLEPPLAADDLRHLEEPPPSCAGA
jgi:hypothetical protein